MVKLRIRPNGMLQYDVSLYGKRFREGSGLKATPQNVRDCEKQVRKMNAEIELDTFVYGHYFPESKKLEQVEAIKREKRPDAVEPYFDEYADKWLERKQHEWKASYLANVNSMLGKYLLPFFKNYLLSEIRLKHVQMFRDKLVKMKGVGEERVLSNKRINIILVPLTSMLNDACDEYDFAYPLSRLKPLKEEKSDPKPLSQREVKTFLRHVPRQWYDYYLIRFYTGMRGCEVHGLQLSNVDFEYNVIRVRHNLVRGKLTDVKTEKSRRDIRMTQTVKQALKRIVAERHESGSFVFNQKNGHALDINWINQYVWYPTLKAAGLERRNPHQTRHTSAVLHLAAHENPLFVSRLLGHSSTKMLYDVYAPYVIDATRTDGSAFEKMMGH